MNFFGHAVVASFRSTDPAFVLGAMLPDFATMIGERVPKVAHDGLESGVAFHHETDRVFHDSSVFRELERSARQELRALGVSRPSALAIGHIGVEILIDARLTIDEVAIASYLASLEAGRPDDLGAQIKWATDEAIGHYGTLSSVLRDRGVTRGPVDPSTVTFRVARALSSRPRLRLDPSAEPLVAQWVAVSAPKIADAVPALLHEVSRGLDVEVRAVHRAA
jgi:hypothetical protein